MRWRRIILWTLTALIVLLLVASVAGYLFLKTATFQRLALGTIIQKANQATGGRMEIGGFDFQPSTLTAHLYNITLHGTEGPSQPPLLHVDALTVGLKIESLFRREVTLSELLITHPSAYVCVDREGRNNIPNAPPEAGHNHTRIFDMAVGHVLLAGGGVTYKDTVTPLEAELYGARTENISTGWRGSIAGCFRTVMDGCATRDRQLCPTTSTPPLMPRPRAFR